MSSPAAGSEGGLVTMNRRDGPARRLAPVEIVGVWDRRSRAYLWRQTQSAPESR